MHRYALILLLSLAAAPALAQQPASGTPAAPPKAAAPPSATPPAAAPPAVAPQPATVIPADRDGSRHRAIVQRAAKGGVDMLFLGDSITQGWEVNGDPVWEKLYTPRLAMNAGISGDRTQHILWRLQHGAVQGLNPKLVVLMIGTNNSADNTAEEIAAGVEAIVGELKNRLPESKLLVLAIFPRGQDAEDARRKVTVAANARIAQLADDKQVFFLDIGPKFLAADGTLSTDVMPDLLHLSARGYEIWGEAMEPTVRKLLGEDAKPAAQPTTGTSAPEKAAP